MPEDLSDVNFSDNKADKTENNEVPKGDMEEYEKRLEQLKGEVKWLKKIKRQQKKISKLQQKKVEVLREIEKKKEKERKLKKHRHH